MTAQGPYAITENFENELCEYTGAHYAVAVDCCSHAIFLALKYGMTNDLNFRRIHSVEIPKHTFPSVACEIIHAGLKVTFRENKKKQKGPYQLSPTNVWDCALRFTTNMYIQGQMQCISFTGPRKHLKLIKGGAILTDNKHAYEWFKSMRMSGRHECSFMTDNIVEPGWNFYMEPSKSARGLTLIREFYDDNHQPMPNPDRELEYPDLSLMEAFK